MKGKPCIQQGLACHPQRNLVVSSIEAAELIVDGILILDKLWRYCQERLRLMHNRTTIQLHFHSLCFLTYAHHDQLSTLKDKAGIWWQSPKLEDGIPQQSITETLNMLVEPRVLLMSRE